jgi:hypothetical protein
VHNYLTDARLLRATVFDPIRGARWRDLRRADCLN